MFQAWHRRPPWARTGLKGAALALAYFGAALLALKLSYDGAVAPIWPSVGLAVVALARWGWHQWPWVFVGALLANLAAHGVTWSTPIAALGHTLEPLLAVWLMHRFRVSNALERITDVVRFLLVVGIAPLSAMALAPPALTLFDGIPWQAVPQSMALWWLSDAMGLLIVVPLLTTWLSPQLPTTPHAGNIEGAAIVAAVLAMSMMAFGPLSEWIDASLGRAPLSFLVFPALLWAAIRAGPRGASLALVLTAVVAVVRSSTGHGPFAGPPLPQNLVLLELFLAAAAITALLLAAAVCACHGLIGALERAKAQAETSAQETARLMATVRHDLAHPLQAATLFLASMRSAPLPVAARPLLDRTVASLKAMEEMLADLKEVTSLQAGGEEVHIQPMALADILDQLAEEAGMQAAAAGLEFRYVRSSAMVRTDPVLLARMVRNLLANAVRYTPSGRVLLGCRHLDGTLRIEVHDTGPGIPAEAGDEIFKAFRRASTTGPGVGLGLSIARRLATHLKHDLTYRSRSGKGACFCVTVPLNGKD